MHLLDDSREDFNIEKVLREEGRSESVETEEIMNRNDKKRLQTKRAG